MTHADMFSTKSYRAHMVKHFSKIFPVIYAVCLAAIYYSYLQNTSLSVRHVVAIVMTFSGFLLWTIGTAQLGEAFSINPEATTLVKRGLHSRFKHPMYYSQFLAFSGVALFFWNIYVLIAVLFFIAVQIFRMKAENRLLVRKFGPEYEKHQEKVWF